MTSTELTKLSNGITEALKEWARSIIDKELKDIPYKIKQEIDYSVQQEIRQQVGKALEDKLYIGISVKNEEYGEND